MGKPFSLEELHSNIGDNISLEELKAWLDNCVELDHLQILNGHYSLSNSEEPYNTFYLRRAFNKKITIKGTIVLDVKDRGYLKLDKEDSNFDHEGYKFKRKSICKKISKE